MLVLLNDTLYVVDGKVYIAQLRLADPRSLATWVLAHGLPLSIAVDNLDDRL